MTARNVNTEPLQRLIQALLDGDEGFDRLWLERRGDLASLEQEAQAVPLAAQLIAFIAANLAPISELPASEGKKLAKRLMRLLKQADQLLSGEAQGYGKEVASAITGVFWPEPAKFEVVIEESPAKAKATKKKAVKKKTPSAKSPEKKSTAKKPSTKKKAAKKGTVAPKAETHQAAKPVDESAEPEQRPSVPQSREASSAPAQAQAITDDPVGKTQPKTASTAQAKQPASAPQEKSPETSESLAQESSPAVAQLFERFGLLSEQVEPALLETLLQLMETDDAAEWRRVTAQSASLLEPFSIAAEMIGFDAVDRLFKEIDQGLRGLEMPDDDESRALKVQELADLPGLLGGLFAEDGGLMASLGEALLDVVGAPDDRAAIVDALANAPQEVAPIAQDGLMVLDAAGIDVMIDEAIAAVSEPALIGDANADARPLQDQEPPSAPAKSVVDEPMPAAEQAPAGESKGEEAIDPDLPLQTEEPIPDSTSESDDASSDRRINAQIDAQTDALFQRLAALAERVEPTLLENILQLMEVGNADDWNRVTGQIVVLLTPLSIAAEMVGFASLDQFYKAMESGLRALEMPAEEEPRGLKVQALADLPGLHAAMFLDGGAALPELAGSLLEAVDYTGDQESIVRALAGAAQEIAPMAADGVMILDAAGIEEMIDQVAEGAGESNEEPGQDEPPLPKPLLESDAKVETPSQPEQPPAPAPPQASDEATETVAEASADEQPSPFTEETMELLGILAAGVGDCKVEMERLARELAQAEGEDWSKGVKHYTDLLQRLVLAAETIEFDALYQGAIRLTERLMQTAPPEDPAGRERLSDALARLPQSLLDFLAAPHRDEALLALYAIFEESGALESLKEAGRMAFLEGLSRGPAEDDTPQETPKVKVADLALKPDSDADASVLESVASEGPRLAGEFAQLLQKIIAGDEVKENLQRAQRAVHTLKGSANICGIRGIAVLSHNLEDLLEHLGERGEAPDETLAAVLVDAADALESALEAVFSGEEHDARVFAEVVVKVVGWSHAVRTGATEPMPVELEGASDAPTLAEPEGDKPQSSSPAAAQAAPSASLVDGLQKQMGELSIALTQAESRLSRAREGLDQMTDQHIRNLRNVEKLEELADIRGLGTRFSTLFSGNAAASGADYDPLELEEYNELYITTRRLHEGEADAQALMEGLDEAVKVLEELSQTQLRLNHEMQDLIAAARRVPVGQYIPRLQRVVRQTCRSTGKSAEMTVVGSELEVDNEVMDKLLPALLHVLRNAIDHGIEDRETRLAAGKPEGGNLILSFKRVGNAIEVVFSDDGAGLDYHKVRNRALANGLIQDDAMLEMRELALLTLKPGFSTREQVSEISGRGVGMNVVDAAIRELKGALSIDSETGQGYTLTMRVPTSTISMYTLLVSIGEESFAIPGSEVRYAAPFADGEVEEEVDEQGESGRRYFRYGDERYPLEELSELIGIKRSSQRAERPIVLIAYSDVDERAVLADSLDDSRVVIAKKLGSFVPPIPGVSSATILGDGGIVPILELRRLLRREGMVEALGGFEVEQELIKPPAILIVDDSLSMRKSLSQLVADGGWRAMTAVDGIDALRVIEEEMPDAVLVDMEMPAMNGLELTRHLRNNAATRHLPVAMITSRATASHRQKAQEAGVDHYFVKPYREDDVLEFIEQRLHARNSGGEEHD